MKQYDARLWTSLSGQVQEGPLAVLSSAYILRPVAMLRSNMDGDSEDARSMVHGVHPS